MKRLASLVFVLLALCQIARAQSSAPSGDAPNPDSNLSSAWKRFVRPIVGFSRAGGDASQSTATGVKQASGIMVPPPPAPAASGSAGPVATTPAPSTGPPAAVARPEMGSQVDMGHPSGLSVPPTFGAPLRSCRRRKSPSRNRLRRGCPRPTWSIPSCGDFVTQSPRPLAKPPHPCLARHRPARHLCSALRTSFDRTISGDRIIGWENTPPSSITTSYSRSKRRGARYQPTAWRCWRCGCVSSSRSNMPPASHTRTRCLPKGSPKSPATLPWALTSW